MSITSTLIQSDSRLGLPPADDGSVGGDLLLLTPCAGRRSTVPTSDRLVTGVASAGLNVDTRDGVVGTTCSSPWLFRLDERAGRVGLSRLCADALLLPAESSVMSSAVASGGGGGGGGGGSSDSVG